VTDLDVRPSTATGPTVRSAARSTRGPLLVALAVVLAGVLVGVLAVSGSGGRLDVASYSPGGARAVAELLRARGVQVDRVDSVAGVLAAAGPEVTVVLALPEALAAVELEQLADGVDLGGLYDLADALCARGLV